MNLKPGPFSPPVSSTSNKRYSPPLYKTCFPERNQFQLTAPLFSPIHKANSAKQCFTKCHTYIERSFLGTTKRQPRSLKCNRFKGTIIRSCDEVKRSLTVTKVYLWHPWVVRFSELVKRDIGWHHVWFKARTHRQAQRKALAFCFFSATSQSILGQILLFTAASINSDSIPVKENSSWTNERRTKPLAFL